MPWNRKLSLSQIHVDQGTEICLKRKSCDFILTAVKPGTEPNRTALAQNEISMAAHPNICTWRTRVSNSWNWPRIRPVSFLVFRHPQQNQRLSCWWLSSLVDGEKTRNVRPQKSDHKFGNGPECNGHRSQFLLRMTEFADMIGFCRPCLLSHLS
jgi:hypothetical protein